MPLFAASTFVLAANERNLSIKIYNDATIHILIMAHLYQESDIRFVTDLESEYKQYVSRSKELIDTLKTELLTRSVMANRKNNSLEFNYWGYNLIVKPEINISTGNQLGLGQLKAYLLNKNINSNESLLSYTFDLSGKINNSYDLHDFSKFYYYELILNLVEYSINKNKVLQHI